MQASTATCRMSNLSAASRSYKLLLGGNLSCRGLCSIKAHPRTLVGHAIKRQQQQQHILQEVDDSNMHLNQVTTSALRAMLSGDRNAARDVQGTLDTTIRNLAAAGDKSAARYAYVLYMMCENKLVEEAEALEEEYQQALHRMFALLEDSGWRLVRDEDEENPEQQRGATGVSGDMLVAPPGAEHLYNP